MRVLLLLLVVWLGCSTGYAQKMDNVWCFGKGGGIDFNTEPPTPFTSQINSIETVASISDRNTGELLFYTDGATVWDADHSIMPLGNGIGLDPNVLSSVNGAVIVPFIGDDDKYYIFSSATGRYSPGELYYSVVDMSLNGGKGDIVPSQKKVRISGTYTEAMVVMQGCGTNWVVTQQRAANGADFYAYKITDKGLDTIPVVSPIGHSLRPYFESGMYPSADYTKIASIGNVFSSINSDAYLALYDFDPATGRLSNATVLLEGTDAVTYGCAFSANGKRLYTTNKAFAYQYDLTQPTIAAIRASRTKIGESSGWFLKGICRRPDGNIYIIRNESDYLDMISDADELYPNCTFVDKAVKIGGIGTYGIPATIASGGVSASLGEDMLICDGSSVVLKSSSNAAGAEYKWSTGATSDSITVRESGVYTLTVSQNGCSDSDQVAVKIKQPISIELGEDAEICKDKTITLPSIATTDATDKYLWQDGSTDRSFTVTKEGVYHVTVSNECDTISDTLVVTERNCHFFFPTAFSPNGDGLNDYVHLVGDVSAVSDFILRVYNRWGEAVFQTNDASKGWDGMYKGQKAEVGTYYYIVKYKYDGEEEVLKGDLMLVR